MKRSITVAVMAILCLCFFCSLSAFGSQAQAASSEEKITVLTPLGSPPSIKLKTMAPRLDTLEGKTIYIVDNVYPGSDLLLTEMAAWFEREMPKTKALYRRKQAGMGGFESIDQELWAEIKEKADAVIIGLGH
jgi:hypothetical protein